MSKYCWASVKSNLHAHVEWEHWLDVHLVMDPTGRGCLALLRNNWKRLVLCEVGLRWLGPNRCALSSMFLVRAQEMQAILAGRIVAITSMATTSVGVCFNLMDTSAHWRS